MFQLEDCLAFVTSDSGKIFAQTLDKKLKAHGISRSQWIALYQIDHSEVLTQRELAEKLGIREPSATRMIRDMEQAGLVERQISPTDRRTNQLQLTKLGRTSYQKLLPVVKQFKNDTIAGIKPEDLETMKRVVQAMVENSLKQSK